MNSSVSKLLLCLVLVSFGLTCGCGEPKPEDKKADENVVTEMDIQQPDEESDEEMKEPKSPSLEGPKS